MEVLVTAPVLAGKYTLLRRLGEGGMAEVFLARQAGLEGFEKLVVIKRMLPSLMFDAGFRQMFLDEARTAADLRHANVVSLYEVGEDQGSYFMAMEFLHGHHVGHLMRRALDMAETLPWEVSAQVVMDAAQGLHHAHTKKNLRGEPLHIVHRDVSPQNIMVTYDGPAKILDFGIAKVAAQRVSTEQGFIKGKLAYMAPEQAQGQAVDARSDQFALGVVLYELTTLRRAFPGGTPAEVLALVVGGVFPRPSNVVADYPPALEEVVLKAMARDPDRRFASCADLAHALEDVMGQLHRVASVGRVGACMQRLFREALETERLLAVPRPEDFEKPGSATKVERVPGPDDTRPMGPVLGEDQTHLLLAVQDFLKDTRTDPKLREALAWFRDTDEAKRRTNLTPHAGALVGRVSERARVRDSVLGVARCCVIQGAPGMGKTRLAAQVAEDLLAEGKVDPGGAWMVDATQALDVAGLCRAVALALELPPAQGSGTQAILSHVGLALAARGRLLLVLDHVEKCAREAAEAVTAWLGLAPQLHVLVTCQQSISVVSDVLELGPLSFPAPGQLVTDSDAVRLFLERARTVVPPEALAAADPLVLAQIVQQLDGIPLAIELAASRLKEMTPEAMLSALPTDGTLRNAVQWAWELLDAAQQSTLSQLSVFSGGFTLDAAEAVVDLAHLPDAPPVADLVRSLRARSLLRTYVPPELPQEMRFGMYEFIQNHAAVMRPRDVEERHARYFLRVGSAWSAGLSRHGGAERLRRLLLEQHNVHTVFQRALAMPAHTPGRVTTMCHAALALDAVLTARGPISTHLSLLDGVVAAAQKEGVEPALLAPLLEARGNARKNHGQLGDAVTDLREAAQQAMLSHDRSLVARVRCNLGVALFVMGRLDEAAGFYKQALAIARDVRDRVVEGRALCFLGIFHIVQSQLEAADEHYALALALTRETGDRVIEGRVLGNQGALRVERGDLAGARARFEEAMAIFHDMRDRRLEGYYRGKYAQVFHEDGHHAAAREQYDAALAQLVAASDRRHEAIFQACSGALCAAMDDVEGAERLLGLAEAQLRDVGDPLLATAARVHQGHLDLARARLSSDATVKGNHRQAALLRLQQARVPPVMPQGRPVMQRTVTQPMSVAPASLTRSITSPPMPAAPKASADLSDEVRFAARLLTAALQA